MLDQLKLYSVDQSGATLKPTRQKLRGQYSPDMPAVAQPSLSPASADAETDEAADIPSDELDLLILTIGPQSFGIPAGAAQAVTGTTMLVPAAGAPRAIAGLLTVEDRAMTAIDGRALLGLPRFQAPERAGSVAIEHRDGPIALLVDEVDSYQLRCLQRQIGPLPHALAALWHGIAVGLVRAGDDLIVVLDPERIARAASQPTVSARSTADAA